MSDIDTILERLVTDPDFPRLLAAESARALERYDLTPEQRDMLLTQISPDTTLGSVVERRTSKAGMFALLSDAAQLVDSAESMFAGDITPPPAAHITDHVVAPAHIAGHGLNYVQETAAGAGQTFADSDGDGLLDSAEATIGTDPNNWDTDGDGLSDNQELTYGTDPTNADTYPQYPGDDHDLASFYDSDHDGLTDIDELQQYGTDPFNSDTDGDGLSDYQEVSGQYPSSAWTGGSVHVETDPLDPDSDHDGLKDGAEMYGPGDPTNPDTDGDGLLDGVEGIFSTDLDNPDTDGDGTSDGDEVSHGTNPLIPNANSASSAVPPQPLPNPNGGSNTVPVSAVPPSPPHPVGASSGITSPSLAGSVVPDPAAGDLSNVSRR